MTNQSHDLSSAENRSFLRGTTTWFFFIPLTLIFLFEVLIEGLINWLFEYFSEEKEKKSYKYIAQDKDNYTHDVPTLK